MDNYLRTIGVWRGYQTQPCNHPDSQSTLLALSPLRTWETIGHMDWGRDASGVCVFFQGNRGTGLHFVRWKPKQAGVHHVLLSHCWNTLRTLSKRKAIEFLCYENLSVQILKKRIKFVLKFHSTSITEANLKTGQNWSMQKRLLTEVWAPDCLQWRMVCDHVF